MNSVQLSGQRGGEGLGVVAAGLSGCDGGKRGGGGGGYDGLIVG